MKAGPPLIRLTWPGRSTPSAGPEARLEPVGTGDPNFLLIHGDNLTALRALEQTQMQESTGTPVTLAYLDPPFLTGREHSRVIRTKDLRTGRVERSLAKGFDDRWGGLHQYLGALGDRINAARELLAENGCLVVHVDSKTSHYVKILCDEIFGPECFASEIIWRYRRWPSKTRNFQRMHDVLLRYVRSPSATHRFCQLYEPLAESTKKTWGTQRQRAIVDESGRRRRSSTTEAESPGTPLGDVWDIGIVAPVARERTGYPTQKPEALLERLVLACSEPGDLVLDPYAGSGTTLAVAARLGRRGIGIDANMEALDIAKTRLIAQGVSPVLERAVVRSARAKALRADKSAA